MQSTHLLHYGVHTRLLVKSEIAGPSSGVLAQTSRSGREFGYPKDLGQSGTCAKVYLALERFLEGHDIFNGLRQGLDAGSVLCYIVNVNGNDNVVAETGCRQA